MVSCGGPPRLVELGLGKEGFDFLGCHLRIVRSHFKKRNYLFRWPSRRAMKSVRSKLHDLTSRRRWAGLKDILLGPARLYEALRNRPD